MTFLLLLAVSLKASWWCRSITAVLLTIQEIVLAERAEGKETGFEYIERTDLTCKSILADKGYPWLAQGDNGDRNNISRAVSEAKARCDEIETCEGVIALSEAEDEQTCEILCGQAFLCALWAPRSHVIRGTTWFAWERKPVFSVPILSGGSTDAPPSVSYLDCTGPGFDSIWTAFRVALQADVENGFLVAQPLLDYVNGLWSVLESYTGGLLLDFIDHTTSLFFRVLTGKDLPSALSGHCHYGYVNLFVARGRALDLQGLHKDAQDLLRIALGPLLGPYLCFDFLETSSWPLHSRHISALLSGAPLHAELPAASRNPAVLWSETIIEFPASHKRSKARRLQIAVAGAHHGFALEPAEMFQRVLGSEPDVRYYGVLCPASWRTAGQSRGGWPCTFRCERLGICVDDSVASALMDIFDFETWRSKDFDLDPLVDKVRMAFEADAFWPRSELTVCTGPFVLCSSLFEVFEEKGGRPMLVYQGLAFHSMAPAKEASRIRTYAPLHKACHLTPGHATSNAEWGVTCLDALPGHARIVVATNAPLNAAQLAWQTGLWLPVVRFHGLYTRTHHNSAEATNAVLIFRFTLWDRPVGSAFRNLLLSLNEDMGEGIAFDFVEPNQYLSYQDMVAHRAVFLFPWDSELLVFHELYSAAVPLILPDLRWTSKWQPFIPWGSTDAGESERNDWVLGGIGGVQTWPCSPWITNHGVLKGSWSKLEAAAFNDPCSLFWLQQTHFERYPHILRAGSLIELVMLPRTVDLPTTSRRMASFNEQSLKTTLRFYDWALDYLLP